MPSAIAASPPSPSPQPQPQPKQPKQKQQQRQPKPKKSLPDDAQTLLITNPQMAPPTRLLVASIGNPAPYLNTLHSAGHTVLRSLALTLNAPPLTKSRAHANGLISHHPSLPLTLWHSPSLMNVSGPPLATTWTAFSREYPGAGLVVLHDELESALGRVTVRSGKAGARGHNGLRSIAKTQLAQVEHFRIGIGIGRPESREGGVVADYVLRKMTAGQREGVEGCVGSVVEELERLLEGGK